MVTVTELSGNEIYCLAQKKFKGGDVITGNSVNSLGLSEKLESSLKGTLGKELKSFTHMLSKGRENAYDRMLKKAISANGIIGVNSKLFFHKNNLEFITSGCIVTKENQSSNELLFSTSGNGKQFFVLLDAEYLPLSFVFGNIAYSTLTGGLTGKIKSFSRGEIKTLSDIFNQTRHLALERIIDQAKKMQANAIIDVEITTLTFTGLNEMLMTGTAVQHDLFKSEGNIMTSHLSHDEVWSLARMGYVPKQILMDTTVFSLGFMQGFKSVFKLLSLQEIPELSHLFDQARKNVLSRMKEKARMINAEEVIGIKTYIYHLGHGLFEFLAIGTAIVKMSGIKTQSESLPWQVVTIK